ncbi:uncharacterized protein LOC141634541 [Silene latifolia]|uniref:uncharacterized protein LOC141634541 n=1 Tax=Silene latifolia TaxID=37657 RepID=UPI003D77B9C2
MSAYRRCLSSLAGFFQLVSCSLEVLGFLLVGGVLRFFFHGSSSIGGEVLWLIWVMNRLVVVGFFIVPLSMDYHSFICNLSELFIFEEDAVNDEDLITWIMSLGEPSVSSIQLMKDRGNSLFKNGNVSLASSLYKQALNFLCFVGFLPCCDQRATSSLALSLVLNLAICELKNSQYDLACRYCKFVLHFEPSNVKTLYQRALAFKHLNQLKAAQEDFEHVLHLDPQNLEASRELVVVADRLVVNPNGKRVALSFDPLGYVTKSKKPLLCVDVADKTVAASCRTSCSSEPMVSDEVSEVSKVTTLQDHMVCETISKSDLPPPPVAMDTVPSAHSFPGKPPKYSFSNKKTS